MHSLSGHSSMFDGVRRVMLTNSIALEVGPERAEIVIGSFGKDQPDDDKEKLVFIRPGIVATLGIIARVIEEQGAAESDQEAHTRPGRSWQVCPSCNRAGGEYDNYEVWHECEVCRGAGIVI